MSKEQHTDYMVTEGVESCWNYHISKTDKLTNSLCGKPTMYTCIPISKYGYTPANYHIPESWCKKCKELFDDRGDN